MTRTPVLMVMNMKGGVGKTTISTHVAWGLGWHYDANVLLIDYDPQCSASLALLGPTRYFGLKDRDKTLGGILTPSAKPVDPFTRICAPTPDEPLNLSHYASRVRSWRYTTAPAGRLDLVPGDLDLVRLALTPMTSETEKRLLTRWQRLLDAARTSYDIVILDCHPAGSFFTKSGITNADSVLIPVTTDSYAALRLNLMRGFIDSWSKRGGAADYAILFNNPHNRWDTEIETSIRANKRFAKNCMTVRFEHSSHFGSAAKTKRFAPETKKPHRKKAGAVIELAVEELVRRLGTRQLLEKNEWTKMR